MNMHFKLGCYDSQAAGAIQALVDIIENDAEGLF